ncbi:MAG: hypothetical protein MR842_07520 [Clostridiales bacterium]|nr:hypothetical protein [Clostridiales bacterium]MDO4350922.1 hypothetical protein [Eubacteriales bacterium]MDY4009598.1 hypothetical protein [Candidatus Limiplasma sp.]
MLYRLYNADQPVATFQYEKGVITAFTAEKERLLPKQLCNASAGGFAQWLYGRAIDLNTYLHRRLANELIGSRDKTAIAIMTHMFSISDTFTCFADGAFIPRKDLCKVEDQQSVSDFILISSDTSLRKRNIVTPNASTDGSFPKTWKYVDGDWWLYKLQPSAATRSEREISHVVMACGWDAAEYQYSGHYRTRIRSRNFVGQDEFFEPYDSLRFMFDDRSDDELVIYKNIVSLGEAFERAFRRILLADALFMNTDRHMRNYGVIRSAVTGGILRMAPNFDNNQAYLSNPSGHYSDGMLRSFEKTYGLRDQDLEDLKTLLEECAKRPFMKEACEVGNAFLRGDHT